MDSCIWGTGARFLCAGAIGARTAGNKVSLIKLLWAFRYHLSKTPDAFAVNGFLMFAIRSKPCIALF